MIRVLIERYVLDGMEEEFRQQLIDTRIEANRFPGYITGESLLDSKNPNHYVIISSWVSQRHFEAWLVSETRTLAMQRLGPMLLEPEKITILDAIAIEP